MAKGRSKRLLSGVGISLMCAVAALWLSRLGPVVRLEKWSYDWRFVLRGVRPSPARNRILIVTIDDVSLDKLQKPIMFWGPELAQVITRLRNLDVTCIGVDILQPGSLERWLPRHDEVLARALLKTPKVVLISLSEPLLDGGRRWLEPTNQLKFALPHRAEDIGCADLDVDDDDFVRSQRLVEKSSQGQIAFFTALIASRALDTSLRLTPRREVRLGEKRFTQLMPINYVGPPGTFTCVPFYKLTDHFYPATDSQAAEELHQALRGRIALIGAYYGGSQDFHATPFYHQQARNRPRRMSGVELHANTLATLLDDRPVRFLDPRYRPWLFIALSLLTGLGFFLLRPVLCGLLLTAFCAGWGALAFLLFARCDLMLDVASPLLISFFTCLSAFVYRYVAEDRERERIHGILGKFVSPEVADELVLEGSRSLKLGGDRRRITVLFSDIRGFTAMSETMEEEQVVDLLNDYFAAMVPIVFEYGGTVDKFIGDAIMAVFGAPLHYEDHALKAVRCSLAMRDALEDLKTAWARQGVQGFDIGIGLHTGPAVSGRMGTQDRMEYTAIGNTVNLASRIEGANKKLGTQILISEETYQTVLDQVKVEGPFECQVKDTPVKVYSLLGCD